MNRFVWFGRQSPSLWLTVVLLLAFVWSVQLGAMPVLGSDWLVLPKLIGWFGLSSSLDSTTPGANVLFSLRLPRVLLAGLVGASLGLSGALTQSLFRNPLAEPGLLGVNAGAACGAALTIVIFSQASLTFMPGLRLWLLPIASFAGALAVCISLNQTARWIAPGSISALLLTGIAMNALAGAVIGLCTYFANDEQLRSIAFWTLGSLAGARWEWVGLFAGVLFTGYCQLRRRARDLNALALGESVACQVGVDIQRLRKQIIVWVALLSGTAVAFCGMIGFVGLIAPHLVRLWIGPDQRLVLPLSLLSGAFLLVVADTLARVVAIPAEIPVGIFTALLGGPFFFLLVRQVRRQIGQM
jgi:iron complex transport system permease protein